MILIIIDRSTNVNKNRQLYTNFKMRQEQCLICMDDALRITWQAEVTIPQTSQRKPQPHRSRVRWGKRYFARFQGDERVSRFVKSQESPIWV